MLFSLGIMDSDDYLFIGSVMLMLTLILFLPILICRLEKHMV